MKPAKLSIPNLATNSFNVRKEVIPNVNNRWHCHPEVELICFHQGKGTQFVGDSIGRFQPGDIVMVGADLPHYWRFEQSYRTKSGQTFSTVIHFGEGFLGERFLDLPEAKSIKDLLSRARRGLLIRGSDSSTIASLIEKVYRAEGIRRITALLDCLASIAGIKHPTLLSSLGFKHEFSGSEEERLNIIYEYSLKNFRNRVVLAEVAELVNLTPTSFCRYIKSRTGKSYSAFLKEIRIGYACKLLLENRHSVKQVCFEAGFHNFTTFHEAFKTVVGKTPKDYVGNEIRYN